MQNVFRVYIVSGGRPPVRFVWGRGAAGAGQCAGPGETRGRPTSVAATRRHHLAAGVFYIEAINAVSVIYIYIRNTGLT